MFKIIYGILFLMLVFIIIVSFFSLKITLLEKNINKLNSQISNNYEDLQNLKAEWNYLNNPSYLKQMVNKYMPQMVIDNNQNNFNKITKIPFNNTQQ